MPIVLRIAEAGPVFAGLAHVGGARGNIHFGGGEFAIIEAERGDGTEERFPTGAIALAAGEEHGGFRLIRDASGLRRGTRVLFLVPLASFRHEGEETLATVQARAYGG